ncbi:MAG: hypothetical protein ACRELB_23585 [Polyangiaceae bacterium]
MSAAVSLALAIDWRTVTPAEWPYLVDLLPAESPERPSGIRLHSKASACPCLHCSGSRSIEVDPDDLDEPFQAPDGPFGRRAHNARSRFLEIRTLERLRELDREGKLDDEFSFSTVQRRALGLTKDAQERTSRANFAPYREPARVRRPLSKDDERAAREHLQARKVRPLLLKYAGGRPDWLHEVWLELVNPPAHVEQLADLSQRIDRAVWRAEFRLRAQQGEIALPEPLLDREGK